MAIFSKAQVSNKRQNSGKVSNILLDLAIAFLVGKRDTPALKQVFNTSVLG